ncbi:hypothetical protein ROBYS_32320 [Roseobacter sp. OBYS 0001]|nr:hypothetical protein ROBYS_32320 [Roseobacter sp. OBYS 0001]
MARRADGQKLRQTLNRGDKNKVEKGHMGNPLPACVQGWYKGRESNEKSQFRSETDAKN